jgi:hypothetical protein
VNQVDIANQSWNFYHAQPLPDELLLVCARSRLV